MSAAGHHVMNCPAELVEAGDQIRRHGSTSWATVRSAHAGGSRVSIEVEVDHGAGDELETWRPRIGTDLILRYDLVADRKARQAGGEDEPVWKVGDRVHRADMAWDGVWTGTIAEMFGNYAEIEWDNDPDTPRSACELAKLESAGDRDYRP